MVRSVVATGKVEPITKVEIKSKANGIIKALHVDVDSVVKPKATCSSSSTRSSCARSAARRRSQPAGRARGARRRRSAAEEEHRRSRRARTSSSRAAPTSARRRCSRRSLIAQSALDDAHSAVDMAENRKRAAQSQLAVSQAKVTEAARRWRRRRPPPTAPPRTSPTPRSARRSARTVLTRDVEIGSPVSSILNLGANATLVMTLGDIEQVFVRGKVDEADIGHVRLGQPARIRVETFKDKIVQRPRHADLADGRREGQRHQLRGAGLDRQPGQGAQGEHDGQRRDRARGAPELAASSPRRPSPTTRRSNASSTCVDPGAKTGRQQGAGQGRRRQRHEDPGRSKASKQGDKVVLPVRSDADARSLRPVAREPARQQAAQLPHDVRHPVGHDLGRRPVGDGRRLPARQREGAARARQEHRHRLGRPHQHAGRRRARRPRRSS